MRVSIIARPSFLRQVKSGSDDMFRMRLSSVIRGEQIAEHWPAAYNPPKDHEDDLRLFVKPRPQWLVDHRIIRDCDWVDFADGEELEPFLQMRPNVRVVAAALFGYKRLQKILDNQVVLIPQQHVNWEGAIRERSGLRTCGVIGRWTGRAQRACDELASELKPLGIEVLTCFNFTDRQCAVNFYRNIDVLTVPPIRSENIHFNYRTPTKMINAASFGVPSVAIWQDGYEEFDGNYFPVTSMDEMIRRIADLRDRTTYNTLAVRAFKTAQQYHISEIIKKYRQLEEL